MTDQALAVIQIASSVGTLVFVVAHHHLRAAQLTELKDLVMKLSREVSELTEKLDEEDKGYAGSLGNWKGPP